MAYLQDILPWTLPYGGIPWISGWGLLIIALIVWSIVWKGLALWHAAHEGSKGWFVVLLVVNTLGILDILYLYVLSEHPRVSPGQTRFSTW
jgi:hypothetical protein